MPTHGDQVIQVVWVLAGVHLCCKHLRSSRILRVLLGKKILSDSGDEREISTSILINNTIHVVILCYILIVIIVSVARG